MKTVIYYVSDYSPNRYKNRWFNRIYLMLDRYCARHSDFIWDVSRAIHKARVGAGLIASESAPVIHVANGLFPNQISIAPVEKVIKNSIVFMGTLGPENGPDVVIRALSRIRKVFPDATLHIIGGTKESFSWLEPIMNDYNQSDAVVFHGFVPSAQEMSKIMKRCAVAVAPYRAMKGSPRYYGDAGKIRAYCASGLPIISSKVPPLGKDMSEEGAAILAEDTDTAFADAIIRVLKDKKLYLTMRKNAIRVAKTNTWEHQFTKAFRDMNQIHR